MHATFFYCEALINIFEQGTEIFGIATGIGFAIGAISILFLGKFSVAAKLIMIAIPAFIIGIIAPDLIPWSIASLRDANIPMIPLCWIIGIVGTLGVIIFAVITGFLPTIVAFRRNKRNRKLIFLLNILLSIVPILGWNIALFMAFMDDKVKMPVEKRI